MSCVAGELPCNPACTGVSLTDYSVAMSTTEIELIRSHMFCPSLHAVVYRAVTSCSPV